MTEAIRSIAKPAGVDKEGRRLYLKGDKLLTADELQAAVEDEYAKAVEDAKFEREFGLVNPELGRHRVRSYDPKRLDVLRAFKVVDDGADSVDGVTAESAKLHLRTLEILKEQGKGDDYTAEEYMLAVVSTKPIETIKPIGPIAWGA
jgi:hypothetical protein